MEHVTSQRLGGHTARPDLTTGVVAARRSLAWLGSWFASDPIGERLESQRDHDAQLLLRYDRPAGR
jgi:hypothetical protein